MSNTYQFKNLVFEGGGVKGIAYVGAMQALEQKGILKNITRVGGTSAGAINATLFALGYSNAQQKKILKKMKFNNFMDDNWGLARDTRRLLKKFGWYKGDFFRKWIADLIGEAMDTPDATFKDLKAAGKPDLYVYGTNLSTRFGEVFSYEHTPTERIADAVRISMSIPLFFAAVRNGRKDVYVDGGVLNNFPIKLFDREKYVSQPSHYIVPGYYADENESFLEKHTKSSKYVYNQETLGLRLDSKQEIAVFRQGNEPVHHKIDDFFDYIKALVETILEAQANSHLHSDDWARTVYIDTLGVKTTEFDLSDSMKKSLEDSGEKGVNDYFSWFDNPSNRDVINRL